MMNIRLSTSNFFGPRQLFISNLHVIAMRKVIRVNFSPIVCEMLRWDAAAHFLFTSVSIHIFFLCYVCQLPKKLSNDMTDIVKHSVSSTHSISLQQLSLCEWFLKMFTMNGVQYSEAPLLLGQFLFLQPQEPLWVLVVNISEYQSDLSLTMKLNYTWIHFTFPRHYQTNNILCILSPLSNSKTVVQVKETKSWCTSYLYAHLKYLC